MFKKTKKSLSKSLRVVVGYPPIPSDKGVALLSQNRQFQYFNAKTYIYPMVPAYAASNLKKNGYKVRWMDGIAAEQTYEEWLKELKSWKPDVLMVETKSPIVKKHWQVISDVKKILPKLITIWVGDHITFAPEEMLDNSKVDFLITGGDYDFVSVNLLDHLTKKTELEGGIWWRASDKRIKQKPAATIKRKGKIVYANSGKPSLAHDLNDLPFVDRDLTKWKLYSVYNGNYKYTPATYMYSGRDCWWNRCTFCVWDHTINPVGSYRRFSPQRLFDEVKHVVDKYHVKEIFDDAGTFMIGKPLTDFCNMLIDSGYNKKVVFSCNMRLNALRQEHYDLMGKANFRFILYGMESANQKTLDRLDKGLKVKEIEEGVRMAKKGGLDPHLTIMMGYPWETYKDAKRTVALAKKCFEKGYVDTLQATVVIPYPGTPLYKECKEKGWLLSEDYEDYDMRKPVMKSPLTEKQVMELTQELYKSFLSPKFIWRKITEIRRLDDVKFLFMAGWRFLGHLTDFSPKQLGQHGEND
jgi:anaerobic magnesium-protoporphyrin IX monomethyl ester cyclase